jgi:acetyltransferase-like isoleucine patch superfamily enzyme
MSVENTIVGKETKIWHPELVNLYGCKIGKRCSIAAFIEIGEDVIIGDDVQIQAFTFIPKGVRIGNNVFIGPNVTFTNDKYPPSRGKWWFETIIEDNVKIGAGALLITGITIGAGAFVAAGAVVTKNVSPGVTVMGIPARVRRLEK